jgi:FKBP-type peptidyl-prolyl cis-trans isomerase SlyD
MTDTQSKQTITGGGQVIAFHYDLYDDASIQLEGSAGQPPVQFLYGQAGVLSALQEAFVGKQTGDDFSISIPCGQAYGRYYPERAQRILKKNVDNGKQQRFRVGQIIHINQAGSRQAATIVKVGKFNLDIDTNHPLAGKDLTFDVKIVNVRQASKDELAHGHAHGPGGHQH